MSKNTPQLQEKLDKKTHRLVEERDKLGRKVKVMKANPIRSWVAKDKPHIAMQNGQFFNYDSELPMSDEELASVGFDKLNMRFMADAEVKAVAERAVKSAAATIAAKSK